MAVGGGSPWFIIIRIIVITIARQLAWATPVEEQVGAGNKDLNHKWRGSRSRTGESTVQATIV